MRSKTTALFLLITMFSLFASTANAKNAKTQASSTGPSISSSRLSAGSNSLSAYGGLVDVEIHNHTDWSVDVWVDGFYMGVLLPHRHMTVTTGSGKTSLSASAYCPCGRTVTWNSTYYFYAGYTYPWVLEE